MPIPTNPSRSAEAPDLISLGAKVYFTAGGKGCSYCHGIDAKGEGSIPDIRGLSTASIAGAMDRAVDVMGFIVLSPEETEAVAAYLQSLAKPGASSGDLLTEPDAILTRFGCIGCHSLKAGEVRLGPPLDAAGLRQTAADRGMTPEAYVMESIVNPRAFEKEGFASGIMPPGLGTQLTPEQLEAVVQYLLSQGAEQ